MGRKKYKLISILLIFAIGTGVLLTACGSKGNGSNDQVVSKDGNETPDKDDPSNNNDDKDIPDGEDGETDGFSYPMEGNKTLTYWTELNNNVSANYTNLAETPLYREVFERTGVTIKFEHPAAGQAEEQLNLMLASGELPDIIEYGWMNFPGGPEKAIQDGYILELTEIIEKYGSNLTAFLQERPDVDKMVKTDEGNYYVFPFIRGDDELLVSSGPIIRKDWLDDLNLDVPETMEEWYTALKGFKDEKGASAPLTYEDYMMDWGAFSGAYGVRKGFYQENGEIVFGDIEPGFKDFLEEYSKWYKEGLLDQDIATVDAKQITAKMTGDQSGASLGWMASRLGTWMESVTPTNPEYELVGAPYPVLEKGETPKFGSYEFPYANSNSAAITTSCKDVEAAARFLDYAYGEEGHFLFNFGIEGESYNMEDDYPKYADVLYNDPDGKPLNEAIAAYVRSNYNGPFVQDKRYIEQYLPLPQQQEAYQTWVKIDAANYLLPPITPTPDESQEFATIMNEINTYKDEMFLKFLFGDESIEGFDKYVDTIKNMGIDRAIEIQKNALERYNNR